MTTHLQPQPFEIVQHFRFNTTPRQPQESIATYVTHLKRLAEMCNFSNAARLNEMMRDGLVCGVANEKWQQQLLAEDNLTYDKAFKLLLSKEASKKEAKNLSSNINGSSLTTQVHKLNRHAHQHLTTNPQVKRDDGTRTAKTAKPSYHCGEEQTSDKCRFEGAKCRYCHKTSACRRTMKDNNKPRPINAAMGGVSELTLSEYGLPIYHV